MPGGGDELEDAGLTYIYLDVISCGLGGAILLGVILASPREQKPLAVATAPYLSVRAEISSPDGVPDADALPNLWVKPPGAAAGFDLPLEKFDLKTGRARRGVEVHPELAFVGVSETQIFLTGFYRHDSARAEQLPQDVETRMRGGLFEALITEPPAGAWEFRIKYQNRRKIETYLADGKQIPAIRVELTAQAAGSATAEVNEGKEKPILFGTLSDPVMVSVAGGKVKHVAAP